MWDRKYTGRIVESLDGVYGRGTHICLGVTQLNDPCIFPVDVLPNMGNIDY